MGILARNEPPNMQELRKNAEFFPIFETAAWSKFFQHLNSFHHETALQFALNLTETHSKIRGLLIEVYEVILADFISLPQVGRACFGRITPNVTAVQDFLVVGDQLRLSRRGIELQ